MRGAFLPVRGKQRSTRTPRRRLVVGRTHSLGGLEVGLVNVRLVWGHDQENETILTSPNKSEGLRRGKTSSCHYFDDNAAIGQLSEVKDT